MSLIEPDDSGDGVHGTEEVTCSYVVINGNAAILLKLVDELHVQVPDPIPTLVLFTQLFATAANSNHDTFSRALREIANPFLGIVSTVGDNCVSGRAEQKGMSAFLIMC